MIATGTKKKLTFDFGQLSSQTFIFKELKSWQQYHDVSTFAYWYYDSNIMPLASQYSDHSCKF